MTVFTSKLTLLAAGVAARIRRHVMAALREIDYNGYLSAEVFPLPDSKAADEFRR